MKALQMQKNGCLSHRQTLKCVMGCMVINGFKWIRKWDGRPVGEWAFDAFPKAGTFR